MVYWFTGQPSHGKTVLANMFKKTHLPSAYRIDGDEMRELFTNKDYSIKGRVTKIILVILRLLKRRFLY